MFLALAITCDEYFVTSLEKICEVLVGVVVLYHRRVAVNNARAALTFALIGAEIRSE